MPLPLLDPKIENEEVQTLSSTPKLSKKRILQAKMDRLWLQSEDRIDPHNNVKGQMRCERILSLLQEIDLQDKRILDMGCGTAPLFSELCKRGARVEVLDISSLAEQHFRKTWGAEAIFHSEALPETNLDSQNFDLILCNELVADFPPKQQRVLMCEAARLLKKEGFLCLSSNLDFYTVEPLEKLLSLLLTEFEDPLIFPSYHRLHESIEQLGKRIFGKGNILGKSRILLQFLEKISKAIWQGEAISHTILLAKKKVIVP